MDRPLRLLSVEDEADDLDLILLHLRRQGYAPSAHRVETADALRAALRRTDWDAVISDYHLPAFDAAAALAVVQASGQDLPFIVVSGTIGDERAVALMQAGADDFVRKENLGRLATAIEHAIGNARTRRERARALELLHATNQELTTLVEAAPLAILSLDPAGILRSWNPAAARLFGWPAGEVLGREAPWRDDDGGLGFAALRAQARGGRTITAADLRLRHRDGQVVETALSLAPLGSNGGVLVIAEDTAEHRRLEAMLLQAQKMEAIGLLAGGVAHDFNNLLAVIIGFGERLQLALPESDRRRRPVDEICHAAERASALTRQLLAFSRKQERSLQEVEINAVVRQMEGMLRRLIGEDIALHAELTAAPAPVRCDPNQIEMVLMNLAVNARDAMPTGGELQIATAIVDLGRDDPLVRSGLAAGRHLLLSMTDTGTGMDAATREHIFEPFYTTKGRGRGTGLGLATVFGIITQSGGHIGVASAPGRGTTFTIHLPLAGTPTATSANAATEAPAEASGPETLGGSETILVVEDDDDLRHLLCMQLQGCGYGVLDAATAEAALSCQRDHRGDIHLLLTDVILPRMGGVMLSQELVRARPGLRVLYMSGYTDDAIRRQGLPTAGAILLEKPFRPNLLLRRIREALAGSAR